MSNSPLPAPRGILFIVSAPSGTGKTTLVERLVHRVDRLHLSRSYTSRPARAGEQDGVDYHFVSRDRFDAMAQAGEFLEWADIYGHCYGTHAAETEARLAGGEDVVLVIDVQGTAQVRARGIEVVGIFVLPPSAQVLEERLRGRSNNAEADIRRRLDVAGGEVGEFDTYEYVVINDEIEPAVDRLRAIVIAERARTRQVRRTALRIVETFRGGE